MNKEFTKDELKDIVKEALKEKEIEDTNINAYTTFNTGKFIKETLDSINNTDSKDEATTKSNNKDNKNIKDINAVLNLQLHTVYRYISCGAIRINKNKSELAGENITKLLNIKNKLYNLNNIKIYSTKSSLDGPDEIPNLQIACKIMKYKENIDDTPESFCKRVFNEIGTSIAMLYIDSIYDEVCTNTNTLDNIEENLNIKDYSTKKIYKHTEVYNFLSQENLETTFTIELGSYI